MIDDADYIEAALFEARVQSKIAALYDGFGSIYDSVTDIPCTESDCPFEVENDDGDFVMKNGHTCGDCIQKWARLETEEELDFLVKDSTY